LIRQKTMPGSIILPAKSAAESATVRAAAVARFTLDGSEELERHLTQTCEKVLAGIRAIIPAHKLEALLLGGGYGRGQGGVLKTESGDRPYNDLEFYVFIRGNNWLNERLFGKGLHHLAHQLTSAAGIEIEFKIISSAKLRHSPTSMFYYDLVVRHHRLWGDENFPANCEHHRDARNIPLSEATRLLMNRCTGLLLAREKLERVFLTTADTDFVSRNLAKAQLAFGDAVLTAFGQYHWNCLRRHERLRRVPAASAPWLDTLQQHHAAGVKFKLHPHQTPLSRADLRTQHENVTAFALKVWLWLESCRLGMDVKSARDYALNPMNKYPDSNPWRNRLVNAKIFGPAAFLTKHSHRHPRERILNALALLLWEPAASDSERQRWLCAGLRQRPNADAAPAEIYQKLWRQLN